MYLNTDILLSLLLDHPSVIYAELSSADALKVIHLLDESRAWDGIAGQVILWWPANGAGPC